MGLVPEHLLKGLAVACVSAGLVGFCVVLLWRRMKANLAWERGLARPLVLDAIRQAVKSHRDRLGRWPTSKGDLRVRVGVDERSLKTVGKWDIRLVTAARDGSRARYSIMVKDSWEEWEATMPSADDDLILGHASGGGQAGE